MTTSMPAPGAGLPLTPRGLHRAAVRSGALVYTVPPLVFMLLTIVPAWLRLSIPMAVAITAVCALYGAMFAYACALPALPAVVRGWWLAVSWLLVAILAALIGTDVGYFIIYVLVLHALALRGRGGTITIGAIAAGGAVLAYAAGDGLILLLSLMGAALAVGTQQAIDKDIVERELAAERERSAVLAVAVERERIGRDLHDILGHSLTTITVNAQLAQRLIAADPQMAQEQIAQIEAISRQALADVRATVSGMQQVRVASEIASARSVLEAAGIAARVPASLPTLDDARAELFGFVVREGVTNAVRHSRASTCTIDVQEGAVSVTDDGVGIPAEHRGSGLAGLRRRVEDAGGSLTVTSSGAGTQLRAELDGAQGRAGAAASTVEGEKS